MNKSQTFTWFNKARSSGKYSDHVLRKALSIAQRKEYPQLAEYNPTINSCNCEAGKRGIMCSHRLLRQMEFRAKQQEDKFAVPQNKPMMNRMLHYGSDGTVSIAEQSATCYTIHTFESEEALEHWAKNARHGQLVSWGNAHGARRRPDIFHFDFEVFK